MTKDLAPDPRRGFNLLWRSGDRPGRGPKSALSAKEIARAGIALADAEGIESVSMRRIAGHVGCGPMSLYRHVPGKGELLDLMLDAVLGELATAGDEPAGWRARLERVAHENWELYRRHPWAVHVATGRPPLGPGVIAKYERELRAVDGLGLSEVEMDLVVTVVTSFVKGTVAGLLERTDAERATGITEQQWWEATEPFVDRVFDAARFPTVARVGPVAGAELQAASDPERSFAFGLARLLDGVAVLVSAR